MEANDATFGDDASVATEPETEMNNVDDAQHQE